MIRRNLFLAGAAAGAGLAAPALVRTAAAQMTMDRTTQMALGGMAFALATSQIALQRAESPLARTFAQLESEATEVQLHVLGERGVTGREDEPVASRPVHVARVVVHHLLVEQVCRRGQ